MVQILESTKDFDICGGLNPSAVRVSTANSKAEVISSSCAIFRPATAEFRLKTQSLWHNSASVSPRITASVIVSPLPR
jgi:hypothetical protein